MAGLNYPADLKYATTDEWVRVAGDEATIGISDYAQSQLGEIVFLDLPWDDVGQREIAASGKYGDVDSVKATSELYSPVAGTIIRVNADLKEHPEIVNQDPYGNGWMIVVKLSGTPDLGALMDADAYQRYNDDRDH
ncbi:MAG TPA: glycine cleavage system protein GcvH [Ktedonobacterales bacterium]|jgi:glycine cleavage system H protein